MVGELIAAAIVLLVWATLIATVAKWHTTPGNLGLRGYGRSLVLAGSALTLLLPPLYAAVDRLSGRPNLARLLIDTLAVLAAWSLQSYVAQLRDPDRVPLGPLGSAWAPLGTIATMAVLFSLADVAITEPVRFVERYASAPVVCAYTIASMWYLAATCVLMTRVAWSNANEAADRQMRLRLRLYVVAWLFGLAYTLHVCLHAVLRFRGIPHPLGDATAVSSALVITSTLFNLNGEFYALVHWMGQYQQYRRLYPLWRALCAVSPRMPLLTPRSLLADLLPARRLDSKLYDRALAIADAAVLLAPFRDLAVDERAAALCRATGLSAERAAATVEAASLAVALAVREQGNAVLQRYTPTSRRATSDVNEEITYLCAVADAFRRSPIVGTLRSGLSSGSSGPNLSE